MSYDYTRTVSITPVSTSYSWDATPNWITITRVSVNSDDWTITLEQNNGAARSATLTVRHANSTTVDTITVNQAEGAGVPDPTATPVPTSVPTATPVPTAQPTPVPTAQPTPVPTAQPTLGPTPAFTFATNTTSGNRFVFTPQSLGADVAYTIVADGQTSPAAPSNFSTTGVSGTNLSGPTVTQDSNVFSGTYRFTKTFSPVSNMNVDCTVNAPYGTSDTWYCVLEANSGSNRTPTPAPSPTSGSGSGSGPAPTAMPTPVPSATSQTFYFRSATPCDGGTAKILRSVNILSNKIAGTTNCPGQSGIIYEFTGTQYIGDSQTPFDCTYDSPALCGGGFGGGGGGGCHVAGELLTLANGETKAVENIVIGDDLLSINFDGFSLDGEWQEWKRREETLEPEYTSTVVTGINVLDFDKYYNFNNGLLKITEEHPVLVKDMVGDIYFKQVRDIVNSDWLLNEDNIWVDITSIELVTVPERFTTYSFNVEECDLYFANGIVVHNVEDLEKDSEGTGDDEFGDEGIY